MWITLLIVIFILAIFLLYDNYILEKQCANVYNTIDNDNDIPMAKTYLNYAEFKYNKNALDNYRIGNIYDFVLHDQDVATNYYKRALNQTKTQPENDFVRDRIRDRIVINNTIEQDDNHYNIANIAELERELHELELALEESLAPKATKSIDKKIQWTSDSQNVHDSNINNEVKAQFDKIRQYNEDNHVDNWRYEDIVGYITSATIAEDDRKNIPNAVAMLNYIAAHNAHLTKIGISEKKFVETIFDRIMASGNHILIENFILNLKECYADGHPVCTTGRLTRIMSSFAGDIGGDIGILKSHQVIKNEIYGRSANIRDKILIEADQTTQDKYNEGIADDSTNALINKMKQNIDEMLDEYKMDFTLLKPLKSEIYLTL